MEFASVMINVSKASKSEKISPDLDTPTDLPQAAVEKISASLNVLLADAFALYMKTKNFHWHVSGRQFRDYHLMLDEQSDAIFATTDQLAERVRKLGGTTLHSIGEISKLQTIQEYRILLYALLVIMILLFRPDGLLPRPVRRYFPGWRA